MKPVYDDELFFKKYSEMDRSRHGLAGAGEWPALKKMLPDFGGRRVLDLGCGYGWHCAYAAERGAASVVGVDISEKMLAMARDKTSFFNVEYLNMPIEDISFEADSFDIVLSSLALHYVRSFEDVCRKVRSCLAPGGHFVFSVEHPVFTAYGTQDWLYADDGRILCWPVDRYFAEGQREAKFLGMRVQKYHKTLTTYLNGLLQNGFAITEVVEPRPTGEMLRQQPEMEDELRRPMMLLVSAKKR